MYLKTKLYISVYKLPGMKEGGPDIGGGGIIPLPEPNIFFEKCCATSCLEGFGMV